MPIICQSTPDLSLDSRLVGPAAHVAPALERSLSCLRLNKCERSPGLASTNLVLLPCFLNPEWQLHPSRLQLDKHWVILRSLFSVIPNIPSTRGKCVCDLTTAHQLCFQVRAALCLLCINGNSLFSGPLLPPLLFCFYSQQSQTLLLLCLEPSGGPCHPE